MRNFVRWRELEDWVHVLFPRAVASVEFDRQPAMVNHRGTEFVIRIETGPTLHDHIQVWGPPAVFHSVT